MHEHCWKHIKTSADCGGGLQTHHVNFVFAVFHTAIARNLDVSDKRAEEAGAELGGFQEK